MNITIDEIKKTFKGCGFGASGNCCNICFSGPCRLDPFTEAQLGKCDFDRLRIIIADLLIKCNYQLGKLLNDNAFNKQMGMLQDIIHKSQKWISQGGKADETEGVDLFLKASHILLDADLNYIKSGRNDMAAPGYKSIYMVGKEGLKSTVFSLLEKEDFINSKDDMTLVCDESDLGIWPILCGFGSAGFTVYARLPLPVEINRRLLNIINELLHSGSEGRIIESGSNR